MERTPEQIDAQVLREEIARITSKAEALAMADSYERDAVKMATHPALAEIREWAPIYHRHAEQLRNAVAFFGGAFNAR